jgi:hypothetical protein
LAPLLAKLKAEETSKKSLVGELDLLTVLLTVSVDVVSFDEPQTRDPGAYGRLKGTSTQGNVPRLDRSSESSKPMRMRWDGRATEFLGRALICL